MSEIKAVISSLQESGLVVQGLPIDQIESFLGAYQLSTRQHFIELMRSGRSHGIYLYQDQAFFDRDEFARKLGEIGFDRDEAKSVVDNLRPAPTPELSALGGRD
jgi:hypothetical protein